MTQDASCVRLARCTTPGCPVRYRTGPDHLCADHGRDDFAVPRAALELGIDVSGELAATMSAAPGGRDGQN